MVHEIFEREDEIVEQAREALERHGLSAQRIVTEAAEAQFAAGNVVGAFYMRLVARSIEGLIKEWGLRS